MIHVICEVMEGFKFAYNTTDPATRIMRYGADVLSVYKR